MFAILHDRASGRVPIAAVTSFDAGFTFLTSENVQLDLSGGVGHSADDWFAGTGISFRLPR
jgi:hypothetical protein